jgi:uncharacterized membrane protein
MCNDGHKNIAWFLVLLPFILIFLAVGMVSMNQKKKKRDGMSPCDGEQCKYEGLTQPPSKKTCNLLIGEGGGPVCT